MSVSIQVLWGFGWNNWTLIGIELGKQKLSRTSWQVHRYVRHNLGEQIADMINGEDRSIDLSWSRKSTTQQQKLRRLHYRRGEYIQGRGEAVMSSAESMLRLQATQAMEAVSPLLVSLRRSVS